MTFTATNYVTWKCHLTSSVKITETKEKRPDDDHDGDTVFYKTE